METIHIALSNFVAADFCLSVLELCQKHETSIQAITYDNVPENTLSLSMQSEKSDFSALLAELKQRSINESFLVDMRFLEKKQNKKAAVDYYFTVMAANITPDHVIDSIKLLNAFSLDINAISTRRIEGASDHLAVVLHTAGKLVDTDNFHRQQLALGDELGIDLALQSSELYHRQWRLACFDMDSTLIQVEVIDELAKAAGIGDQVCAITERAMRGELDFKQSFSERLALLEGLSDEVLAGIAKDLPLSPGVETLIMELKKQGIKIAILSGGFQYFAKHLQQLLGFDYIFANTLEIIDGKVTGVVRGDVVDADRKALLLKELAEENGIPIRQVIAVGDGANDLKMLDCSGLGVAFRAKPIVKSQARQAISVLGLDAVIYLMDMSRN